MSSSRRALLEAAILTAVRAHAGQRDLAGEPYILHPLRVMGAVEGYDAKIVAVLHDVVEDCGGWPAVAHLNLPPDLRDALDAVTHRKNGKKEPHGAYMARVAANPLARLVKMADLLDNSQPERHARLRPRMKRRLGRRYPACIGRLLRAEAAARGAA